MGEILVDVTVLAPADENKMRFGGIAHAARAFWAIDQPFDAAVIVPAYLEASAAKYFARLGCRRFTIVGRVDAAPNVILIFDPAEVGDQGYELLLRDEKRIVLSLSASKKRLRGATEALIFPGDYDLRAVCGLLPRGARLHIDVAYDVSSVGSLRRLPQNIETIFISTSSPLFKRIGGDGLIALAKKFKAIGVSQLVLKENRGGSRLYDYATRSIESIPTQLGSTANSVGVGDVYDAVFVADKFKGPVEAAWRAASAASAYSQTTYPDLFRTYVRRERRLRKRQLIDLGGTTLPWEKRRSLQIYLAAPDFKHAERRAIDQAVASLEYHNFRVRRPVKENGELRPNSGASTLKATYEKDVKLLRRCALVFAVPTGKDPGTLVEVGLAIQMGVPVVIYDPKRECANTMVIAGSTCYSHDLDTCLNAVFEALSTQATKQ